MRINDSQFDALAGSAMDRVRRERLFGLSQRGFSVSDDPLGRAILVTDASGSTARVESLGLRARVISPEGRVTETEQYASGRIRSILDPSGRRVRFERDADGFLKSINRGSGGGVYGFQLSEDWKPLRVDYPDGTISLAEYSSDGQPTRIVNRDGSEIHYEYADRTLTSLVDPKGHRTRLSHSGPETSRVIDYPNGDRHTYVADVAANVLRFDVNGEIHPQYDHDM